jgi:hypothetical protein
MKAKKPLLLFVLTLVLLVVALILPAAASASTPGPKKPLNWASAGGNTNNTFVNLEDGVTFQGGYSYLVKELSDHSLVGHVQIDIVKSNFPGLVKNRDSTTWLTFEDPLGLLPDGSFHEDGTQDVDFFAVFDLNDNGVFDPATEMAAWITLVDSGPGRAGDEQWIWFSEAGTWAFFGTSGPSFGDVAVHMDEQ